MKDYYKILGIRKSASEQEIKHAYRQLSLKYHPDKNQDFNNSDTLVKQLYFDIQEAHDVLTDKNNRFFYDSNYQENNAQNQDLTAIEQLFAILKTDSLYDLTHIESLLEIIPDIDAKNKDGNTLLILAVYNGNIDLINMLLKNGASIEEPGYYGRTPFMIAALAGNVEKMNLLLNKGANINATDKEGKTALHIASWSNPNLVKSLINAGADLNLKDTDGNTALHLYAKMGRLDSIKILLENKTDINAINNDGDTALGLTLLYHQRYNIIDVTKFLIENGADIYTPGKYGKTALHLSLSYGCDEVSNLLLEKYNFNIEDKDAFGNTALLKATDFRGSDTITQKLLDMGANVQTCNNEGETPLHNAARYKHPESLKLLLNKGANIDAVDSKGQTPLIHSIYYSPYIGYPSTLNILLENGADIWIKDKNGKSAIMYVNARNSKVMYAFKNAEIAHKIFSGENIDSVEYNFISSSDCNTALIKNIFSGLYKKTGNENIQEILEEFNAHFHDTKLEGLFDDLLENQSPEVISDHNDQTQNEYANPLFGESADLWHN